MAAADGAAGRGYPLNTMYAGSGLPDTAVWMRPPCIKFFQFNKASSTFCAISRIESIKSEKARELTNHEGGTMNKVKPVVIGTIEPAMPRISTETAMKKEQ